MKKMFAMLLVLCLMPAMALAAVTVSQNGVTVSKSGSGYMLSAGTYTISGSDSQTLDITATGDVILKLNGLNINNQNYGEYGMHISGGMGTTVKVVADGAPSTLVGDKYGLFSEIPLTIDGPGKLTCKSVKVEVEDSSLLPVTGRVAIRGEKDITIVGGEIEAVGHNDGSGRGIDTDGVLTIGGGRVTASGYNAALYAKKDVVIRDAELTISKTNVGIWSREGKISFENCNAQVKAEKGYSPLALYAKEIEVISGSLLATAEYAAVAGDLKINTENVKIVENSQTKLHIEGVYNVDNGSDDDGSGEGTATPGTAPDLPQTGSLPETGDPTSLLGWSCLLGAAGAGLKLRKKQR